MYARWLLSIGLLLAGPLQAASVLKCIDASGGVTFTQKVCPEGFHLEQELEVSNEAPRGSGASVRMAEPPPPAPVPEPAPVVVAPPPPPPPPPLPPPRTSNYVRQPDLPYYRYPSQVPTRPWHRPPPPPPPVEPPVPPPPEIRGAPTHD